MPRYGNNSFSGIISTEFPFAKSLLEPLRGSGNLDELNDAAAARSNLGLGALATLSSVSLSSHVTGTLPVANGGTGAANAPDARTALGLGSLATLSTAPIANGGTGSSNASDARAALGVLASKLIHSSAVKSSRPASVSIATLATVTVPGGSLGPNGWLEIRALITGLNTATAGSRTVLISIGGTTTKQHQPVANANFNLSQDILFHNRNSEASNIVQSRIDRADFVWGAFVGVGASGDSGSMAMTVNTANNFDIVVSSTSIDASDTCHLQFLQVIAHYAP
jgi:hypothetical protein